MVSIVPTITAETPDEYARQIDQIKPFVNRIHVDVADGVFVPRKLVGLSQVYDIDGAEFDLHLMVSHPESELENVISLQPDLVIIHFEADGNRDELIRELRNCDIRVGLAINVDTTIQQVSDLLPNFDHLLIFTGGHLGYFSGQFQAECLDKIAQARAINPNLEIAVDGGVDQESAQLAIDAGANVLNCGSFIHDAKDPEMAYVALAAIAESAS